MEEKFLSIYLTASSARSLLSTKDVVGVDMASTSTVKIWYKGGRTATLTLNAAMAANINTVSDFLINEIAQSYNPNRSQSKQASNPIIIIIPTPFPNGIVNAAGAAVTVTSIVIA
jgi:hypothetical protein